MPRSDECCTEPHPHSSARSLSTPAYSRECPITSSTISRPAKPICGAEDGLREGSGSWGEGLQARSPSQPKTAAPRTCRGSNCPTQAGLGYPCEAPAHTHACADAGSTDRRTPTMATRPRVFSSPGVKGPGPTLSDTPMPAMRRGISVAT